jgi:Purine nucleoside phosphorylase
VEPVSHESVVKVFTENNEKLRRLLFEAIPKIGPQPQDTCATALREPGSRNPAGPYRGVTTSRVTRLFKPRPLIQSRGCHRPSKELAT